jgi:hypothetical protein
MSPTDPAPHVLAPDADPESRPGVPMQAPSPELEPGWPARQRPPHRVFVRAGGELTPLFGTAQPPGGLSGRIRAFAYGVPETRASHWMLLLGADRLEQWEHRVRGLTRGDPDDFRSVGRYVLRHPLRTMIVLGTAGLAIRGAARR